MQFTLFLNTSENSVNTERFIGQDKVRKWIESYFLKIIKPEVKSLLKCALPHRLLKGGSDIRFPHYSK
jgi:hypothetical protein